ncbi:MAG: hypothetical protein ISS01_00570 [Nanoarchaeota archaeon]|nr:hypothetical protein [Nanoarchaeota archaeon]
MARYDPSLEYNKRKGEELVQVFNKVFQLYKIRLELLEQTFDVLMKINNSNLGEKPYETIARTHGNRLLTILNRERKIMNMVGVKGDVVESPARKTISNKLHGIMPAVNYMGGSNLKKINNFTASIFEFMTSFESGINQVKYRTRLEKKFITNPSKESFEKFIELFEIELKNNKKNVKKYKQLIKRANFILADSDFAYSNDPKNDSAFSFTFAMASGVKNLFLKYKNFEALMDTSRYFGILKKLKTTLGMKKGFLASIFG